MPVEGRGLSSRQTQYVAKNLGDWVTYKLHDGFRNCRRRRTPNKGVRSCPREAMGRAAEVVAPSSSIRTDGGYPVAQVNDLSRSLTAFDPISTLVVVVEMSKAKWLVSGAVPGV